MPGGKKCLESNGDETLPEQSLHPKELGVRLGFGELELRKLGYRAKYGQN